MTTTTFHVIAESIASAERLALLIARGLIPDLYPNPADALAAWRAYPLPMHRSYIPFSISLSEAGNLIASNRIADRQLAE